MIMPVMYPLMKNGRYLVTFWKPVFFYPTSLYKKSNMPGKHLYEYAVIRIVPRVEREEFINAGVILYCASLRFLEVKCTMPKERLKAFGGGILDITEIETRLKAFEQVCKGGKEGGPIG